MGTGNRLGVGRMEVDWGKHNILRSHEKLFLPQDLFQVTCQGEKRAAYRRNLRSVRRRLALLGYSMVRCREIFENDIHSLQFYENIHISWSDFVACIRTVDLDHPKTLLEEDDDYDLGEYAEKTVLENPAFEELAHVDRLNRRTVGMALENIDPYITLRVLADNPQNLRRFVVWRTAELVDYGYTEEGDITAGISAEEKYLVVTEGSSDSAILQKSLDLLFPDVADFFDFIDMSEHYPFTGTGNLSNFCKGLARIGVQNQILVVFDNDAAGREALDALKDVVLPKNMKTISLPNMRQFETFPTLGPNGPSLEDVNGKAASIELYLDLRHGPRKPAVRWTSYNKRLRSYQGELVEKERYVKGFHENVGRKGYALARLKYVWEKLLETCAGEPL